MRRDFQSLKGFSDTYSVAANNIVAVLDSASTVSTTITENSKALDSLLLSVTGLSNSGVELLGPSKDNLIKGINTLEPTTNLLEEYSPELTCVLIGGKNVLDFGFLKAAGGLNGKSAIIDAAILFGDDQYRYPDNLPITNAKGGVGGTPGNCGSLPDVAKNWPARQLVTDTGFGTGLDNRPNPGIGFPGSVNYLPTTRGLPEPPRVRYPGPPAPGPVPTRAHPPTARSCTHPMARRCTRACRRHRRRVGHRYRDPVGPGTEPFSPPYPAQVNPTPGPLPPDPAIPGP